MSACEIYGLYDPRDGALRYIGKANDSAKRLKSHFRDSRRRDTPVYRWFRKLAELGLYPSLKIIETTEDWRDAERRLIAEARARKDRLLNVADGGDEPFCPPEVRAENGRRVAQMLTDNPAAKRIWQRKRMLGSLLKSGHVMNKSRAKMREAARIAPHIFGAWANIPDREENADGSPVGGYR